MTAIRPTNTGFTEFPQLSIDWSTVGDTMWVGRRRGEFAGIVESKRPGEFTAFDSVGARLESHPDLVSAQRSLEPEILRRTRLERTRERVFIGVAGVTAVVAGGLGITALFVGF
ncbi:hypothetical protein ACFSBZ_15835 [Amnibacterium flavum]|uniref:Peptide ABC transporter permease n=1 Tax=Amnibacterium flavum TaxID=2173173 RepID=A0A2V1HUB2_9MICO|nr:hypothetical protein [Amnibacterium flavum]PVZ96173.1 hypothetical protein DDQ50_07025 [Amnibacterium flavum]